MSDSTEHPASPDSSLPASQHRNGLYEKMLELRKKMEEEGIPFLNDEELDAEILSRKTGRW